MNPDLVIRRIVWGPLSGVMAMVAGGLAAVSFYGTTHRALFLVTIVYLMGTIWYMICLHSLSSKIGAGGWGHVRTNMLLDGRSGNDIGTLGRAIRDVIPEPGLRHRAWLPRANLVVLATGVMLLICGVVLRW